jgi:tetratricopeptide (TPR) repeat protein
MNPRFRRLPVISTVLLSVCLQLSACNWQPTSNAQGTISNLSAVSTLKPMPLEKLVRQVKTLPAEELKAQLAGIVTAGEASANDKQDAAYMLGRILQKGTADEQKDALQLFTTASQSSPLWERSQWHISECAAGLGNEKTVRQALQAIQERSTDSKTRAAATYALAQSYLRGNEPERAKETFLLVRKDFPGTQYATGAAYYLGEMSLKDPQDTATGIALFREYLKSSPDGHFARDIAARLGGLSGYTSTVQDKDLIGQVHYLHGEWQQALDRWKQTGSDQRWFESAICLTHLRRQTEAEKRLDQGIKAHPNDASVVPAAQLLCKSLSREQAIALWQAILARSTKYGDVLLFGIWLCERLRPRLDITNKSSKNTPLRTMLRNPSGGSFGTI